MAGEYLLFSDIGGSYVLTGDTNVYCTNTKKAYQTQSQYFQLELEQAIKYCLISK